VIQGHVPQPTLIPPPTLLLSIGCIHNPFDVYKDILHDTAESEARMADIDRRLSKELESGSQMET
jgi:hypothetical protein